MSSDEVPAFEKARQLIEKAIAALNRKHKSVFRIVWGGADKDDTEWQTLGDDEVLHQQSGLLSYQTISGGSDYEILLTHAGDSGLPDMCSISTEFEEPQVLPRRDPRHLYNSLKYCGDGVTLSIGPECYEDDAEPEIVVYGVDVLLPIEQATERTFYGAFSTLRSSHDLVYSYLQDRKGDDHWSMDGGQ